MTKQKLFDIQITGINNDIYRQTKEMWDHLSKPLDGMGEFEEIICQIAAIQNNSMPNIENRVLIVYCADNGIVSRNITQSGQDVTYKVALALGEGKSTACCLAKNNNTKVLPVDIGINSEKPIDGVLSEKISLGTKDFLVEPAMTEKQFLAAVETGIHIVEKQVKQGYRLIATGEMGIGNTTTSTAILSALLSLESDDIVGRGAGLDDTRLAAKKAVVKTGMKKYQGIFSNAADERERCFEIARCLGGYDIAAMCGTFIGGAIYKVPVIIDGLISAVAALIAEILVPNVKAYMIASHSGKEKGTGIVLEKLQKNPFINGNMALGEGTGAILMISLLDHALYLYQHGIRFYDAGIQDYERFDA